MTPDRSLEPNYFDAVYAANPDPWNFATSAYEAGKYAATLAALPRARYRRALEIGCSIGVFTAQLAERCDALLAIDVSDVALAQARARCAAQSHVRFARMQVPRSFPASDAPDGAFDLITLCEVGYYWSGAELGTAAARIREALAPGGTLLLVHWTDPVPDYPLGGDEVHDRMLAEPGFAPLAPTARQPRYRLDVLGRVEAATSPSVAPDAAARDGA